MRNTSKVYICSKAASCAERPLRFLWIKHHLSSSIAYVGTSLPMDMGVGGGPNALPTLVEFEIQQFPIKFLAKKVALLVLSGLNEISPLLAPSWKNHFGYAWKKHHWHPWKKSFRRPCQWISVTFTKSELFCEFQATCQRNHVHDLVTYFLLHLTYAVDKFVHAWKFCQKVLPQLRQDFETPPTHRNTSELNLQM